MDVRRQQVRELHRQIEWTLARAADPRDVLPMLHRLVRLAEDGSDESVFANLRLAELLVERDPWRAALCARRALTHRPADDRVWATLALCQTLLGNYRFAASAYHHALSAAPDNPWYAHNLGHLLDVALCRADDALPWLERAYRGAAGSGDVAASYAHALARAGRIAQARRVLTRAMKRTTSREHTALLKWVEQGAPADLDHPLPRPAPVHALVRGRVAGSSSDLQRSARAGRGAANGDLRRGGEPGQAPNRPSGGVRRGDAARGEAPPVGVAGQAGGTGARHPSTLLADLDGVLTRGLASLPLDGKQRARAKSLARDAAAHFSRRSGARGGASVEAVAAAVAYAIVYVDHVPLTQAEVAACFRVSVASLRGRFAELRAQLDLTPGDERYATLRLR